MSERRNWTLGDLRTSLLEEAGALGVVKRIAKGHGVSMRDLLAGVRTAPVVRARDQAVAVVRWSTGWSSPHVGRLFGLDHSSVLAAVARHEARLNEEGALG